MIQTIIIWSICVVVVGLYCMCILQSHQHSIRLFRSVASLFVSFFNKIIFFLFFSLSFSSLLRLFISSRLLLIH